MLVVKSRLACCGLFYARNRPEGETALVVLLCLYAQGGSGGWLRLRRRLIVVNLIQLLLSVSLIGHRITGSP